VSSACIDGVGLSVGLSRLHVYSVHVTVTDLMTGEATSDDSADMTYRGKKYTCSALSSHRAVHTIAKSSPIGLPKRVPPCMVCYVYVKPLSGVVYK